MEFRTAYGEYERFPTVIEGESRAKQSFKDECDINRIVERFAETGLISHVAKGQPRYLDVSEVGDYREALDQVERVSEFFAGLPAELRSRFRNDPAEFLDFMSDPSNVDEIEALGLSDVEVDDKPSSATEAPQGASVDDEEPTEPVGDGGSESE